MVARVTRPIYLRRTRHRRHNAATNGSTNGVPPLSDLDARCVVELLAVPRHACLSLRRKTMVHEKVKKAGMASAFVAAVFAVGIAATGASVSSASAETVVGS